MSSQARQLPLIPLWQFAGSDASTPAAGKFTTDAATPHATTELRVSSFTLRGPGIDLFSFLDTLPWSTTADFGAHFIFTDLAGRSSILEIGAQPSGLVNAVQFTVDGSNGGSTDNWSGIYGVTFSPGIGLSNFSATVTPVNSITVLNGVITGAS